MMLVGGDTLPAQSIPACCQPTLLPARLSHGVPCLPWHTWAHGHDSDPQLPVPTTSPTAVPALLRAWCRAVGRVGFSLPQHGESLCESRRKGTHKEGLYSASWCRWEEGFIPPGRTVLKHKVKELGFTLPLCAHGIGSQVGKSNQTAQKWPAGPM